MDRGLSEAEMFDKLSTCPNCGRRTKKAGRIREANGDEIIRQWCAAGHVWQVVFARITVPPREDA